MNFARLWARITRTFWDKCPRCERPFAGYQKHARNVTIDGEDYRIVCGRCSGLIAPKQIQQKVSKMEIALGSRLIGDGHPPFIIAEVGSNWTNLDDCLFSIQQAKLCGADAVKFQLFGPRDLHFMCKSELLDPSYLNSGMLLQTDGMEGDNPYLNPEWLPKLKEKADAVGIEFMCTAFSPELYDVVDPYVNIHKVASAELTHVRILEKLRSLGKPVILSTGASGEGDISIALNTLKGVPVVLMYCVAAYPAREVDLDVIDLLRNRFKLPVGFSDHTTDVITVPRASVRSGSCVIEKHFTAIDSNTPDAPHSIKCDEFKRMVDAIRGKYESNIGPTRGENQMVLRHNRRLLAIRQIHAGETLVEDENFGIYRSLKDDTRAASPFHINLVNGKTAKKTILAGDGIALEDVG